MICLAAKYHIICHAFISTEEYSFEDYIYLVVWGPVVQVTETDPEALWWWGWRTVAAFEPAGWALLMALAEASFPLKKQQHKFCCLTICKPCFWNFKTHLQFWDMIGMFSALWALTSADGEGARAGLWTGGGPASLETLLLLAVANIWLVLWPSRGPLSCSDVRMSAVGTCLGAFRDPKPEPMTEDWKHNTDEGQTEDCCST